MVTINQVIEFLKDQTGCNQMSVDSAITEDLGVDDFDNLINNFSKEFNVDVSSWLWYFHCGEESGWNNIGAYFFLLLIRELLILRLFH